MIDNSHHPYFHYFSYSVLTRVCHMLSISWNLLMR